MRDGTDITARSAVELAADLRAGRLRAVDVATAFLDRIARYDGRVRAVVELDRAGALRQAAAADRALAEGKPLGPLHGVPMTIKDCARVAGTRSTFGQPLMHFYRPKDDCEAVARLRRAGAVVLGRTAVPFACFDWQCRPPLGRECRNPLDPAHTPGGSSGGAAAALAARFTPLELGSDLAGSIRYPAHCCGVYGLRTTVGLVPAGDVVAPGLPMFPSVMALGPLARSVEDVGLLLGALLPDRDPREVVPSAAGRLRVAVTREVAGAPLDGPSAAAVEGFAERLAAAGHTVTAVEPPFDFEEGYALWGLLVGYEFKALLPRPLRARAVLDAFRWWLINYRLGGGPLTEHVRRGLHASEAEYRGGLARRAEIARSVVPFFARHDVWVLPVSPGVAIRRQRAGRPLRAAGDPVPYSRYLGQYLCPTAALGTPALSLPAGLGAGGLPVGVQVHAPPFADRWLVGTAGPALAAAAIAAPRPPWDA